MKRLFFIFLLLITGPALAEVHPVLDMSVALPDTFYLDQLTAFKVTDHDADGFFEVQGENNKIFATWSLHYNKTLDYFNKSGNGAGGKYAAAYLDGDTLLDFVEFRNIFNNDDTADNIITVYYSSLYYSGVISQHIYQPDGGNNTVYWFLGCDAIFFTDSDNDGELELYCRLLYIRTTCYYSHFYYDSYFYINYLIDINSDTHTTVDWLPCIDYKPLPLFNPDTIINVAINKVTTSNSDQNHNTSRGTAISYVKGYIDSGLIFSHSASFEFDCAEDHVNQYSIFKHYWIDDMFPATPGYEFVAVLDQRSDGWSYDGTTETHCSLGSKYLACYNLHSREQMDTLWKIDISGQSIPGFIFHDADFPGRFFTLHDRRVYCHDAADGQVVDESPQIFGSVYQVVDYSPVTDRGDPKLIICESGQVKLYDISVTSSTDDPPPETLPGSFVLHAPYPNPFNPILSIPVDLSRKAHLTIEIFNIAGQKIVQIIDRTVPAGSYEYIWDSSKIASGVYLVKAAVEGQTEVVKAVLLK